MTFREACRKWGYNESHVRAALQRGLIPGAEKVRGPFGPSWYIPDDAINPIPAMLGRGELKVRPDMDRREREPMEFLQAVCGTRSIKWIANELGITTGEVRSMYDRLVANGGDCND